MTSKISSLDISQITDYLCISAFPHGKYADDIAELGVRLILSMHWLRPDEALNRPPVRLLWLPTIDAPFIPMPVKVLDKGVHAALPVIKDGAAVMTHCKSGVHRSVAMASCVLIGMGYSTDDAMQLIKEKRAVADPYASHIEKQIRKFAAQWPNEA